MHRIRLTSHFIRDQTAVHEFKYFFRDKIWLKICSAVRQCLMVRDQAPAQVTGADTVIIWATPHRLENDRLLQVVEIPHDLSLQWQYSSRDPAYPWQPSG